MARRFLACTGIPHGDNPRMGQAHRAPFDSYSRRYWITQHAIERLRERLTEAGRTEHRGDRDLGNLLDAYICDAVRSGCVELVRRRDGLDWFVDIESTIGFPLVAVLKAARRDDRRRACVTVLTKDMVYGEQASTPRRPGRQ